MVKYNKCDRLKFEKQDHYQILLNKWQFDSIKQ